MSLRSPQTSSRALRNRPSSPGAEIAALFDEHGRMVLALCRTLLRDPDDAEDAAQQTFLSAHRALVNGTHPLDPPAWLATIARNECRARIAARLAKPRPLPLSEDVAEARPSSDPESQAGRREEIAAFTAALAELPERQREAVVLRDVHGLSYQEVAVAMSVSPPAVESLLSRARRTLEARVRPVRVAQGAPLLIDSLRGRLEALIPEFGSAEAATALASGAGGIAGKLLSLQVAGKVAAGSAVAVVTLGVGAEVAVDRQVQSGSLGRPAPDVLIDSHVVRAPAATVERKRAPVVIRRQRATRIARTETREVVPVAAATKVEMPDPIVVPSAPAPSAPEEPGHHEGTSGDETVADSSSSNSGPGSLSSNSGPGSVSSGSGESGSGESGSSGPGGGGEGSSGSSGSGSSDGGTSGHGGLGSSDG
jgi:RNA polymerase sigma factor (sigma-70 family)